jgi:hypothetical protein
MLSVQANILLSGAGEAFGRLELRPDQSTDYTDFKTLWDFFKLERVLVRAISVCPNADGIGAFITDQIDGTSSLPTSPTSFDNLVESDNHGALHISDITKSFVMKPVLMNKLQNQPWMDLSDEATAQLATALIRYAIDDGPASVKAYYLIAEFYLALK